ncbi:hypothetical protein FI667_g4698, partial [Globisporangium splendens]
MATEAWPTKRALWCNATSTKAIWLGSMLLFIVAQIWMFGRTPSASTAQTLLRVNMSPQSAGAAESVQEPGALDAGADKQDPPSALDIELQQKYNEDCVKMATHHLEKLFIKPDLCISPKRMQQILVDLVFTATDVFAANNITSFLDSGTLLGAHRHKSVIPFDVDSDMAIDAAGYEKIKVTLIRFPQEYYLQVFGTPIHPAGTRYIEIPARLIHRESALYLDIFVYNDSVDADGTKWTGPLPAGAFINCAKCPRLEETRWEFKLPYEWVYPLKDCRFAKRTLKCPAETEKYLEYMLGSGYMTPVETKDRIQLSKVPDETWILSLHEGRVNTIGHVQRDHSVPEDDDGGGGAGGRVREARRAGRSRDARGAGAAQQRREEPRTARVAAAAAREARIGTRRNAVAQPHGHRHVCRVLVVGVYRFVHRLGLRMQKRERREVSSTLEENCSRMLVLSERTASITASILGVLCIDPSSRSAVISLLSTNTASLMFRECVSTHPELACLKPLVFMLSGGWIMYSGFFHPESYETSHLNLIMKYTLVSPQAAHQLQEQYRQGLNPSACTIRHPGVSCNEYLFPGFMKRVVKLGYRVYFPVHFTAWLISLRHAKARATPPLEMATKFFTKLTRSAMYFISFVAVGWTLSCHSSPLGDRSLAWRKFQFILCGSLPAVSLLWESPARRRPIGVILVSYVLVSVGAVLTRRLWWLKQGSGPVRTAIDVALFTTTVVYTLPTMLQSNRILQRLLLGASEKSGKKTELMTSIHGGNHTEVAEKATK